MMGTAPPGAAWPASDPEAVARGPRGLVSPRVGDGASSWEGGAEERLEGSTGREVSVGEPHLVATVSTPPAP